MQRNFSDPQNKNAAPLLDAGYVIDLAFDKRVIVELKDGIYRRVH